MIAKEDKMNEHTPVSYGYFKSQVSRFFQAESWAITGPDHDHEESWDIVADGIPDEATARFIVTACNCHAGLLEALKEIAKGEGAFNRDPLTHAMNTINNLKLIANEAIQKFEETQ